MKNTREKEQLLKEATFELRNEKPAMLRAVGKHLGRGKTAQKFWHRKEFDVFEKEDQHGWNVTNEADW